MDSQLILTLCLVLGIFLFGWLAIKLVSYLKMRNTDTALWGSIVDGLTQKVVPIDTLKEPEVFIEKRQDETGDRL